MNNGIFFVLLTVFVSVLNAAHFRGGTVTWRPVNSTPSGSTVQIIIRQRYSWRRASVACTDTTINNQALIGDGSSLSCRTGPCSPAPAGYGTGPTTATYCTDWSSYGDVSSGERFDTYTLSIGMSMSVGFVSSAWFADLVVGANSGWNVINLINTAIRPDGTINNSPLATTLPVIYKAINVQHVHVVQMSDLDATDTLKCRWSIGSTSNINSFNECGGVCNGVPGATLSGNNCTITFTLTQAGKYAAAALQIEDYYLPTSSTPMSSVPLQFLFYGFAAPTGCSTPPAIIGNRPNRACIGVSVGINITEYVIAQVNCPGKSIIDFVSSSPVGMRKTAITNPSSGIYQIVLTWVPKNDQFGPQGFCAGAVDNTNVQSDQWCITFLVGFSSPDLIRPTAVQGSASPIGTIFQTHTIFSIQATRPVNRPTRNGTYIHFRDSTTNTLVRSFDCGWEPEVIYTGYTLIVRFPSPPWIVGHSYYVLLDSGVASGTEFCGPESAPITDPTFWTFNIWDPGLSSTATTTTTPPTTGTVTTRPVSTSTVNTMLTTTGIVTTTPATFSTTTTTSSTSTVTTTTTSDTTTTTTTTAPQVDVMYPIDMEKECQQPVIIMSALTMASMTALHIIGMYTAFTKFSNIFNPKKIQLRQRYVKRMQKMNPHRRVH